MTQILRGERDLLVRSVQGMKVVVANAADVETDKHAFDQIWRRTSFKPEPLAVLNPPKEITKHIKPRPGYVLLFAEDYLHGGKMPAAWVRWATEHGIAVKALAHPTAEMTAQVLTSGVTGITFTPGAAEWYIRVVGTSQARLETELSKLVVSGITHVDREKIVLLVGGVEDLKAERLLKALGTPAACKLALDVPVKKAIPLMVYLDRALAHRKNSWALALSTIRKGGDLKRYTYWTGVQMFAHYCLRTVERASPEQMADDLIELSDLAGLSAWTIEEDL